MRLAHIVGSISAATLVVTIDRNQGARSYPYSDDKTAPNDTGPVVDTTPKSKRAKRRANQRMRRYE